MFFPAVSILLTLINVLTDIINRPSTLVEFRLTSFFLNPCREGIYINVIYEVTVMMFNVTFKYNSVTVSFILSKY